MKRLMMVLVFSISLSAPVIAGEIPTGGITPPPPQPPPPDGMQSSSLLMPGEIPTSGLTYEITDTTLDLIQMLLGVGM